jgi:serine/threonine protein kinase
MKNAHLQPDLLFCRQCRRHFRGKRRQCPTDGHALELVSAFPGQAGDVLDERYLLTSLIGVGGMGSVFRARDQEANRDVALKLLRSDYASNASAAQRFFQEARLLRQIRHPAVVGLHRFSRTADGHLLIDMELVDGESVRDRVLNQGHGLDFASAMAVLDQLLAALAACHDAGVVHCDVKPENLMLPRHGGLAPMKLVDFGVAQAPGPVQQSEDICIIGTPAYMSPEQVRGASVDGRTDLYLVGCVAYELLTGDPPFLGATALDLCHSQLLDTPPALATRLPAEQIPVGFEAWLQPLLAKDPALRPSSARQVREHLRSVRHAHRDAVAAAHRLLSAQSAVSVRPPSASLLRRPSASTQRSTPSENRNGWTVDMVRALVEVRQAHSQTGIVYGAEAIEQIARHVLAGPIQELREMGAEVRGPAGPHLEIRVSCAGDERGVISHLLDTMASMNAHLARIPEPRLELRAAIVAELPGAGLAQPMGVDPLELLSLSPMTQVRVDEFVARWAGRRALVKLTSVTNPGQAKATDIYATSLNPV